jgi:hypothetical protein
VSGGASEGITPVCTNLHGNIMPQHLDARLAEVARLLFGRTYIRGLADAIGCPHATAKCWCNGSRRPPVRVLKELRRMLQARAAACLSGMSELDLLIVRREGEPKRSLSGICAARAARAQGLRADLGWRR